MLDLMLFTNEPALAFRAEMGGIGRIVIDLEQRGKEERQAGYHLEKNIHSVENIREIRTLAKKIPIMARINPVYEGTAGEVEQAIAAGANIIMLPMFRSAREAGEFLDTVNGRVRTNLLLETAEAAAEIDAISKLPFDELYVGLNDLGLSYGKRFCFELVPDGTIDRIRDAVPDKPFGFGGITVIDKGEPLPTEMILGELARLGATLAIVRRAFKRDIDKKNLRDAVDVLQTAYAAMKARSPLEHSERHQIFCEKIYRVSYEMKVNRGYGKNDPENTCKE